MRSGLLERYAVGEGRDSAELLTSLRRVYRHWGRPIGCLDPGAPQQLRGIEAPEFFVGLVCSTMAVSVEPTHGSYYFNISASGAMGCGRGGEQAVIRDGIATVYNPGDKQVLSPLRLDTQTLGIRLDRSLVDAELAGLLGRPLDATVRFDLVLDLRTGPPAAVGHHVRAMVERFDSGDEIHNHPMVRLGQVRTLVSMMLLAHRHNYTDELRRGHSPLRPRTLRIALEHIEQNLAEPLTIGDIARSAGCSARTLTDAFREHLSVSPGGYVRDRRLEMARTDLLHSADRVGDIAYRWGFTHLGRFAGQYQRRYGELPSDTVARR